MLALGYRVLNSVAGFAADPSGCFWPTSLCGDSQRRRRRIVDHRNDAEHRAVSLGGRCLAIPREGPRYTSLTGERFSAPMGESAAVRAVLAIRQAASTSTSTCPTGGAAGGEGGPAAGGAAKRLGGLAFTGFDAHALIGLGLMVTITGLMVLMIARVLGT